MQDQDKEKLCKRAKRKYINTPVLTHLINLNSPLKSKYISSLACSSLILQKDGKLQSHFCKRMWCSICSPIKTAIRLNNYSPLLLPLVNLQMTTLTIPNVPYHRIKESVQYFRKVFRQFRDTEKKRTGSDMKGVYNFEVTYNNTTKLFHPHIHIIHEGLESIPTGYFYPASSESPGIAQLHNSLIKYWLLKEKTSRGVAQDTRPCTDLIEGFKYQSKSVFYIKKNNQRLYIIPAKELDQLYTQLAGVRCFQPFGIKMAKVIDEDKEMDKLTAYESDKPEGSYLWDKCDWFLEQMIDNETGEILNYYQEKNTSTLITELTGFRPNKKQLNIHEKLSKNADY